MSEDASHGAGVVEQTVDDGAERPSRRFVRQTVLWVFGVSFAVFALSPVITNYDSYSTFPTAVALVNHHTLSLQSFATVPTLAHSYTVSTANGHLVTAYPWTTALFFVPTVGALDLFHLLGGPSPASLVTSNDMGVVQMETASVVTALACAVMGWLAFLRCVGSPRRRRNVAIFCGLVFAFGTTAWSVASRSMWQHGPSLLLLALGLVALDRVTSVDTSERIRRWAAALCGASFACAFAVRPTNAVPFVVVGVVLFLSQRRHVIRYAVAAAVVLLPWIGVTYAAYGTLLQPYFGGDNRGLQSAFLDALAANLVSPARGLLVFSPVVLAAVGGLVLASRQRQRLDPVEWVAVVTVPATWLLVSGFGTEWWAGNTYGPRFMTETLPFLFVLSLPLVDWLRGPGERIRSTPRPAGARLACLVVLGILAIFSVTVNAEGGVLRSTTCWNGTPVNVDSDPSRVWSWSDPQFLTGFRSLTSGSIHQSVLSTCHGTSPTTGGR